MPQSTIFRFTDHKATYLLINHVLRTLKYYVYKTRENGSLELKVLKGNIQKIKNIEKQISLKKPEKQKNFEQNWSHCKKTHRTFFEIYGGAAVGWEQG